MPPLRSRATLSQVARSAVSSVSGTVPSRGRFTRWRSPFTSRSQEPWPGTVSRTRARPAGMSKAFRSKRSSSAPRASGGPLIRDLRRRERPPDALTNASGLLGPLHVHREAGRDREPAVADLLDRHDLGGRAEPRAGRHGCREADLVPAVVD